MQRTRCAIYLLCAKTSSATEGATSRGSQARSVWMSCWAPLVRDRKDSWGGERAAMMVCKHISQRIRLKIKLLYFKR